MNSLHDSLLWALTPEAEKHYKDLIAKGVCPDLAFALLETLVPEQAIYSLDKDEADE